MSQAGPVRIRTPALFGGVSKQPAHIRFPNQVADAENVDFYVEDGINWRDGTWFVREICAPSLPDNPRMHVIDRDGSERYLVLYGQDTVRVFEIDGPESIVTITPDAQEYISANSANADQLRLRTIADYTLILNTTVKASAVQSGSFTVTAEWRDYDVMIAHTPLDDTYHKTLNDVVNGDKGYYHYDVEGTTFATITFPQVSGREAASEVGLWNNSERSPYGFFMRFQKIDPALTAATFVNSPANYTLTQVGKFADYVWVSGDKINITGGTGVTTGWSEIASRTDDDEIVLTSDIGGANPADVAADGIASEHEVRYTTDGSTRADMYAVSAAIQAGFVSAGAADALCEWSPEGPLVDNRGQFIVTSPYRGDGAKCFAPSAPSAGTDLTVAVTSPPSGIPAAAPFNLTGTSIVDGVGDGSLTLAVADRWFSVQPPGDPTAVLDASTMPVQMIRTVAPTGGSPAEFKIDLITWKERESGDNDTNPVPSLWKDNRKIRDLVFHEDRLIFLGDERIVMSQTSDLFNVFKEDADNAAASDPIDVGLSSEQVTLIDYGVQFRNTLVVFTQAGQQFEIASPEALSADTVGITPSTRFFTRPVRPIAMDQFLYFLGEVGCNTQLLEYVFDDSRVASTAADVTAHVPGYVPETIRSLAAHANTRVVLVLPKDGSDLYVYRAFWIGNQKEQSAWTKYTFDSGSIIDDIGIIGSDCYMLIERSGGGGSHIIERFKIPKETGTCPGPTVVFCGGVHTNTGSTGVSSGGGSSGAPGSGSVCPATVQIGSKVFETSSSVAVTLRTRDWCTDPFASPELFWEAEVTLQYTLTYVSSVVGTIITWEFTQSGATIQVTYNTTDGWTITVPGALAPVGVNAVSGTKVCAAYPMDGPSLGMAAQELNAADPAFRAYDKQDRSPTPEEFCSSAPASAGGGSVCPTQLELFHAVTANISQTCLPLEGFFVPVTICCVDP